MNSFIFVKVITIAYLQRLFLDGFLQINVGLVCDVKRELEFGDVDLELLLDAGHLRLQFGLGLHNASVQLLNLDAGLLTVDNINYIYLINERR